MTAPAPARELPRSWRPSRFDLVLAGVVLVAQVGGTVLAASHQSERRGIDALAVVLLAAGPVALVWRRRFPLAVYGVSFAATLAYSLIGYGRGPIFFSLIVAFVTVVNAGHRAVAWVSIVVGYFAFEWAETWFGSEPAPDWPEALGLAAWLLVLATGTEIVHIRRERSAERAHSAREEQLRRASDERLRIARDLHDVVAHNISLINVQASVALHLGDELPEQADAALRAIKDASKDALDELQVGPRRPADGRRRARAPTPTLDDVDQLIERATATGLDVVIDVQGVRRRLPQPVEVAAYRVVQEALTNVVRHAGSAAAVVTLSYDPDAIVVQVDDDGPGSPPNGTSGGGTAGSGTPGTGTGLLGMRERVAALGGRLDAAARPSGGFRVRAWIPVGGPVVIRVVLADDQALVRAGFRALLDAQDDIEVVGEAANGDEAVAATKAARPDVVLMDIRMPGSDGLDATRRIGDDPALPRGEGGHAHHVRDRRVRLRSDPRRRERLPRQGHRTGRAAARRPRGGGRRRAALARRDPATHRGVRHPEPRAATVVGSRSAHAARAGGDGARG